MLSEERSLEIAGKLMEYARGADEIEAVVAGVESALTRFANNGIHQNVAEKSISVNLRVAYGKRVGTAAGNQADPESLRELAGRAAEIAKLQPENPEFAGLPAGAAAQRIDAASAATQSFGPEDRAEGAAMVVRAAAARSLNAFGAFRTSVSSFAVVNSNGVSQFHRATTADANAVVMGDQTSGMASALAVDVGDIDMAAIGAAAADKAERGASPTAVEPGRYAVVLEEAAVAQMVEFLAFESFNGLFHEEGRSFTTRAMNTKVMGENVSIWEDGADLAGIPSPFDGEGVPRQRVDFIDKGVLKSVVYDHQTAAKFGRQNTGHAWIAPNPYGPVAANLFMAGGEAGSAAELAKDIERGIWVTTFHYTNLVEPMRVVLTGMTRHGTFLIENGEITRPLKNLRFTQSVLDAFSNVQALTKGTKLTGDYLRVRAPAIRVREFNFTGVSEP